ncbi:MarR family winged helix-turn-helix transcriptional regulator [Streptomyces sp. NPDC060334]|uniref:MarR family winged helix-turn-helix transcriptional regulator n=1 Tax=unclassified Streptomyces TaxID=2593676 RepID=UPI0006AF0CA3|nr:MULTISPECIES: MarR family transcriptional regulator [unclassified Streptomyces]KOU68323.1 MarR family transcriptional regulator [Streptomyces sp. WM4235]MCX5075299.1 MarR family transcriptional regulator [Streptomyces sp. NBC_00424]MCX5153085.1 MarR family transcriptional regulator [Streptomyces sp. NBC_00291]WUD41576.1 MarR family transcriptional regulator [Streptomyces sp. NBC_00513]
MAHNELSMGGLTPRDHAFYGLVWAGTTLTARVDQALTRRHDLPLSWFEVMLWLHAQQEPVASSELGARTLLSRSQVSRVADSLQARGLVERIPSPTDARSVRIALTDAGRRAFREADATRREALAEVFDDRLDDADIAALGAIWAKLKA